MSARSFPTLAVASVTTEKFLAATMGDVYEVCQFVLGDPGIVTHQLPAAMAAATAPLLEQHPWLADLDPPGPDDPAALAAWQHQLVDEHGAELVVSPRPEPL